MQRLSGCLSLLVVLSSCALCGCDDEPEDSTMLVDVVRPDVPGCVWRADEPAPEVSLDASARDADGGVCPLARLDRDVAISAGCAPVRGGPVALRVAVSGLEPRGWVVVSTEGALAGEETMGRADERGVYALAIERTVGSGEGSVVVQARNRATQRIRVMPRSAEAGVRRVSFLSVRGGAVRQAIDICSRIGPDVRLRATVGELEGADEDGWAARVPALGGPCEGQTAHSRFVWTLDASEIAGAGPTSMELVSDGVTRLVDIPLLADGLELALEGSPVVSWSRTAAARQGSVTVSLLLAPPQASCAPLTASGVPTVLTPPAATSASPVDGADDNGVVRFTLTVPNEVTVSSPFVATLGSPFGAVSVDVPLPPEPLDGGPSSTADAGVPDAGVSDGG